MLPIGVTVKYYASHTIKYLNGRTEYETPHLDYAMSMFTKV